MASESLANKSEEDQTTNESSLRGEKRKTTATASSIERETKMIPSAKRMKTVKHRRGKKKRKDKRPAFGNKPSSNGMPDAPSNTTQFIMNDHGETIAYLDHQLGVTPEDFIYNPAASDAPRRRITRARESSFSLNSDEEFFYSSPSDEEDFVSKEFLKDYNNVRADRLVTMSKGDLITEYVQMEGRVDGLEKQLERSHRREEERRRRRQEAEGGSPHQVEYDIQRGEVPMEPEVAQKISVFQREIHRLEMENRSLLKENLQLKQARRKRSRAANENAISSSSDDDDSSSSSSSSSSSDSSSSDSSSDEEEAAAELVHLPEDESARDGSGNNGEEPGQDTGYESGQSGDRKNNREEEVPDNVVTSTSS